MGNPVIQIDFGSGENNYGPSLNTNQTTYNFQVNNDMTEGENI